MAPPKSFGIFEVVGYAFSGLMLVAIPYPIYSCWGMDFTTHLAAKFSEPSFLSGAAFFSLLYVAGIVVSTAASMPFYGDAFVPLRDWIRDDRRKKAWSHFFESMALPKSSPHRSNRDVVWNTVVEKVAHLGGYCLPPSAGDDTPTSWNVLGSLFQATAYTCRLGHIVDRIASTVRLLSTVAVVSAICALAVLFLPRASDLASCPDWHSHDGLDLLLPFYVALALIGTLLARHQASSFWTYVAYSIICEPSCAVQASAETTDQPIEKISDEDSSGTTSDSEPP